MLKSIKAYPLHQAAYHLSGFRTCNPPGRGEEEQETLEEWWIEALRPRDGCRTGRK